MNQLPNNNLKARDASASKNQAKGLAVTALTPTTRIVMETPSKDLFQLSLWAVLVCGGARHMNAHYIFHWGLLYLFLNLYSYLYFYLYLYFTLTWTVRLLRQEISKNGGLSSWLLFFSFIFLFWVFKCRIALLCNKWLLWCNFVLRDEELFGFLLMYYLP